MSLMPATAKDCLAAFEGALQRADLGAALAVLSDDVVFFYSNGSAHWGKEAIRAAIQANWDSLSVDNYATRDHIWVEGGRRRLSLQFLLVRQDGRQGRRRPRPRHDRLAPRGGRLAHRQRTSEQWTVEAEMILHLPSMGRSASKAKPGGGHCGDVPTRSVFASLRRIDLPMLGR